MNPRRLLLWIAVLAVVVTDPVTVTADPAPVGTVVPVYPTLAVWPDTSGSLDRVEYENCLEALVEGLQALVPHFRVTRIEVHPWATPLDTWRSTTVHFVMPEPPSVVYQPPRETENDWLFRQSKEKSERQARQAYDAQLAAADSLYQLELRRALARVRDALRVLRQGKATCTSVLDCLQRCAAEDDQKLILVITDLKNDCPRPSGAIRISGHPATTVAIVVPAMGDQADVGTAVLQRITWLGKVAPWAHAVPSFRVGLTPGWLDAVLSSVSEEATPATP